MRNIKELFFLKGLRLGNLEIVIIEVYVYIYFRVVEVFENYGICDE